MIASFSEIEKAFLSAVEQIKSYEEIEKRECRWKYATLFTFDFQKRDFFLKDLFVSQIDNFLNNYCIPECYNVIKQTIIPRMQNEKCYEVYYERLDIGKEVLMGIKQHMVMSLKSTEYAYERKAIYLVYSHVKLFDFRIKLIIKKWNKIMGTSFNQFEKISEDNFLLARNMLNIGTKYELTNNIRVLNTLIEVLDKVIMNYISLLKQLIYYFR